MSEIEPPIIGFIKALARRQARIDAGRGGEPEVMAYRENPSPENGARVGDYMWLGLDEIRGRQNMSNKGKLIVLAAFVKNDDGELVPAFDPRQVDTEERAKREARMMADQYAGVVAWSREADPALGEYGPPVVLFQQGEIPELE